MKIYVCGRMRGLKDFGYPAFHDAADRLRRIGHSVFNPAEAFKGDTSLSESTYARMDFSQIATWAEAIVVLPGYEYSRMGACEVLMAQFLALPIYSLTDYDELVPVTTLHPGILALRTVLDVMNVGVQKHPPDTWKHEPLHNHTLKAARHAITAQLIHDGLSPSDGEDHIANALTRSAMALSIKRGNP